MGNRIFDLQGRPATFAGIHLGLFCISLIVSCSDSIEKLLNTVYQLKSHLFPQ